MRFRPLFCCVPFLKSIFSAREGGTPSHGAMGYPALAFILGGFGVCVGVFWPHLGSSLEVVCLHVGTTPSPMGYPILGRFLEPIWCQLGAILGHFGARAGPGWAGGVTRSVKNWNKVGRKINFSIKKLFALRVTPPARPVSAIGPWGK